MYKLNCTATRTALDALTWKAKYITFTYYNSEKKVDRVCHLYIDTELRSSCQCLPESSAV